MTENDKFEKGTVSKYKENSSSNIKAILETVNLRDVSLVFVAIILLHMSGVINLPLVNQVAGIRYSDYILAGLVGSVVAYATIWQKFAKWIDAIYSKNWAYLIYVNATDDFAGAWKTDPETLNRLNNAVQFEGSEDTLQNYREGIDKTGRRYGMIRDLEMVDDDTDVQYKMQNVMGWDAVPDDSSIISDKTELKHWMEEVLPEAEQGREERLGQSAFREKIKGTVVHNLVRKYENATGSDAVNMEDMRADMFESYEKANQEVDNFLRETEAKATDTEETHLEYDDKDIKDE